MTDDGHILRPILTRPSRPLPLTHSKLEELRKQRSKMKSKAIKLRKPSRRVLPRHRITVIDPTRYGATHLTPASGLSKELLRPADNSRAAATVDDSGSSASSEELSTSASQNGVDSDSNPDTDSNEIEQPINNVKHDAGKHDPETEIVTDDPFDLELQNEKSRGLDILASLMGNSETLAWEPDSDLEELARVNSDKNKQHDSDDSDDIEDESDSDESEAERNDGAADDRDAQQSEPSSSTRATVNLAPLKDMFVPHAEEGESFSIQILGPVLIESQVASPSSPVSRMPTSSWTMRTNCRWYRPIFHAR